MELGKGKWLRVVFIVMASFCGIIWSVTNLSYDGEYQIAMAYRLLQGDKMILEMWEPHQTSAFLTAALMWVYRNLFHTTTGIVVYLQVCGIIIRGAIAILLYRVLREDLEEPAVYGIGLLYFMLSPKDYALPEFSNQQVWYSTLLFCCLWAYLKNGKRILLMLGAVCLCLEVLAYPSCVIVFFGVMGILALYSVNRRRDILIFGGVCAGIGIVVACFLFSAQLDVLGQCIAGILALEPTHTRSVVSKIVFYLEGTLQILLAVSIVGGAGFCMCTFIQMFMNKKFTQESVQRKHNKCWLWLLCCAILFLGGFLANILSADNRNAYCVIFLFFVGVGLWSKDCLAGRERQAYVSGNIIGGLEFLATLILTDLSVADSVVYGLLAIVFAIVPIRKQVKRISNELVRKGFYCCATCFVMLLALRCVYIRTPLSGRGQICSSFSDLSIVRTGPALGLISNEGGVCVQRDSYPEWKELIRQGDKVWMIGSILDTLGYLYEDVEVAAPSTMSAPYYSSAILEYWRLNPDKYPDVIVAESYMGELVQELKYNQWLMSWIEEEYQPECVVEGKYWIYYFKEAR